MKKSDFYYELPNELIAQTPAEPRDSSRLLVYDNVDKRTEHRHFRDITDYLHANDVLVINNTRVIPARLIGRKTTGAYVEVLLLKRIDYTHWEVILKPGKRLQPGAEIVFGDELKAVVTERLNDGGRIVNFIFEGVFEDILNRLGTVPLPPYITSKLADKERYQTVYSKIEGSAAAPTAGLHFTPQLLDKIRQSGVKIAEVLLHVGLSTFRPVKVDDITQHHMHTEYFEVSQEAADIINNSRKNGGRIIAVGTTSVRVLESSAGADGQIVPQKGETDIFIYPGYIYKCVDCLITNFHLPESTLIMLVSAFVGYDNTMRLYELAVKERYRFFSFGDSMLLINKHV